MTWTFAQWRQAVTLWISWCTWTHIADSNAGRTFNFCWDLGVKEHFIGFFCPHPSLPLAHLDASSFWILLLATVFESPGCTVYGWKRANRRIFFHGGICRTWDVCIYKYIIYINIYNTDLKNQIPLTYIFFNLCQKCVFRENLIFILRLCIVTHLYKCASIQHGPCSGDVEVSHSTCTNRLANPLFLLPWPLPQLPNTY